MGVFKDFASLYNDSKRAFNHLHDELPYRCYDEETKTFENNGSRGFGLRIQVMGGANDEILNNLNALLCELPQGDKWDYMVSMFGLNQVGAYIDQNEQAMSARGGICRNSQNVRPITRDTPLSTAFLTVKSIISIFAITILFSLSLPLKTTWAL